MDPSTTITIGQLVEGPVILPPPGAQEDPNLNEFILRLLGGHEDPNLNEFILRLLGDHRDDD